MTTSFAYALVVLCQILPEADLAVRQLELSCPSVLERTNHTELFIAGGAGGLMASFSVQNYSFGFTQDGRLRSLARLSTNTAGGGIPASYDRIARDTSLVEPATAHQVATQRLAAIGVDVVSLDRRYHHRVDHPKPDTPVFRPTADGSTVCTRTVPLFWLSWGTGEYKRYKESRGGALSMTLLGPNRQVVDLFVSDESLLGRPARVLPGQAILQELPNEPFTAIWTNRQISVTNVFGVLRTSTAYQTTMLARMLEEANWALRQLGLPRDTEVRPDNLTESFIVPPQFGFLGCLRGDDSYFEFDRDGKLRYVFHVPPRPAGQYLEDYYLEMSRRPSLVNSNSVMVLATDWLKALDVDVERLLAAGSPKVSRHSIERKRKEIFTHIWWVGFGARGNETQYPLYVEVNGSTAQPARVRLHDTSFLRRPGIAVPNADELMAIPDPVPQRDPLMPHLNVLARTNLALNAAHVSASP
jgi:hypothetical protein